jgi:hypothetical protein
LVGFGSVWCRWRCSSIFRGFADAEELEAQRTKFSGFKKIRALSKAVQKLFGNRVEDRSEANTFVV